MNQLHERFMSALREHIQSNKSKAAFIKKKLEDAGFKVTDNTLEEIEHKLDNRSGDGITIESVDLGSDEQIENFFLNLNNPEEVDEFFNNILHEYASRIIPQLIEPASKTFLRALKKDSLVRLKNRRMHRNNFEVVLNRTWGLAIDALELFIATATEAGDDINSEFKDEANKSKDWVFFCISRLHARSCQIAFEILTLLKAGYADGALARWRVLHEVSVMTLFIEKYGESTAEQYFHYDRIEAARAAELYNLHCAKLKVRPIPNIELARLERTRTRLVSKYGKPYEVGNYGWAASALKKKKVDYKDIEEDVNISHLSPYYKQASANIHATPKGLFFSLSTTTSDVLLTGPSALGLMSPAQLTAISLLQVTTTFLLLRSNVDRIVLCKVLTELEKEVGLAFGIV